jgi:hypothetical protein
MVEIPEEHSHPICADCGREFTTVEQLGRHVDEAHRQQTNGQEGENPTNIGPGMTERYDSA